MDTPINNALIQNFRSPGNDRLVPLTAHSIHQPAKANTAEKSICDTESCVASSSRPNMETLTT